MKYISLIVAAVLILSSCDTQTKATEEAMEHKVYTISMNRICKEWDGQWQGITTASDGNCYFSSSTHSKSHGAGFHRFDPRTYEHTILAEDMTYIHNPEKAKKTIRVYKSMDYRLDLEDLFLKLQVNFPEQDS